MTMAQTCGARVAAAGGSAVAGCAVRAGRVTAQSQPMPNVLTFMVIGLHAAWLLDRAMGRGAGFALSFRPFSLRGTFDHDPEADLLESFVGPHHAPIECVDLPVIADEDRAPAHYMDMVVLDGLRLLA